MSITACIVIGLIGGVTGGVMAVLIDIYKERRKKKQ